MQNESKVSFQINLHWIYLIGFFLIIAQIINIFPPWFTPTDWGKAIIFRIILAILIFLFLFQILFRKINISDIKEKIKSASLPFWLLISLFGIYLFATIFSLDPHFSLWGDPRRNGGFVNFAFYIIFAILTFLIIHKKDWQKIWDFAIIIGIIVSIIAIFQQFGIYNKFFIPFTFRPISTLGNAILLSLYLLLLTFISLSCGIKTKSRFKKAFYFFSFLLFLLVSIFLVQTRGAFLGLAIGFLWFLFAYPNKKLNRMKIYAGIMLILAVLGAYFLKTYMDSHLYLYQKMPPIIGSTVDRILSIFETTKIIESRISTWKVSWEALKERPVLGYGPENFMIAFDKYYDPSLPLIGPSSSGEVITEWWDRAHNFVFDISITAGIPALIIYLLLFGVLIWKLQKTKSRRPEEAIISNGVQATFIGYLGALFFTFDSVPTYLISFLFIGYSFYLISSFSESQEKSVLNEKRLEIILPKLYPYRIPIILILFILLILFIQVYNLKPFWLNKDINVATFYSETKKCELALEMINRISTRVDGNIIDGYLNRKLTGVIYNCTKEQQTKDENLTKQAIQIMGGVTSSHPNYLENWFLLGEYINILIEEKNKLTDNVFARTEEMEKLKDEANYSFEKAHSLSPKRQIVLREWAKTGIITEDYGIAKKRLQECIDLNPNSNACPWLMALAYGYSGDWEEFNHFFNLVKQRGFDTESEQSLKQLVDMYIRVEDYNHLPELYLKLIEITEDKQQKAQLYAYLAATYVELGQIENARKEALKILELIPLLPPELQAGARADVDAFLRSLGQ